MTAHYTFAQLEHLWTAAGGARALAPVMAAIAEAESAAGARPYGDTYAGTGPTSWGLWQIHTRDASSCLVNTDTGGRPYYEHALVTDPAYNARAAVRVEHEQGLNAWSTYGHGHGAYLAFMPRNASHAYAWSTVAPIRKAGVNMAHTAHVAHNGHHTGASGIDGPSPIAAAGMIWMAAIACVVMRRETRGRLPGYARRLA